MSMIIEPRIAKISDSLEVKRILPFRNKRMVGPFIFLDHMGPHHISHHDASDVGPHPHIGLSTITYLFEGRLMHRDSTGAVCEIKAGDVNWMTAGKGVVHSERTPEEWRENLNFHGLQAWVALPVKDEDCEPAFYHYENSEIPNYEIPNGNIRVIIGSMFGLTSPVKTHSETIYLDINTKSESEIVLETKENELGLYIIEGECSIDGFSYEKEKLIVLEQNQILCLKTESKLRAVIIGGAPMTDGARHIYWNFVSSSKDKIEAAKLAWKNQTFPKIPGETEFVPLPE